jgi:hypothetical protein
MNRIKQVPGSGIESKDVTIDKLELDPENPRLPESLKRTQQAMLEHIARHTDIEELMQVIGENGFFRGESLIVYPSPVKKDIYRVIEGNRRLCAVMLLSDPELLKGSKKIEEIAKRANYRPDRVPVAVYKTRNEVLTYLGYRHITGVKEWEPLAKARYVEQLFDKQPSNVSMDSKIKTVAQEIGTKSTFIRRALKALAAYSEIEKQDFYEIDGLNESELEFSVLSTALGYASIAKFTGADDDTVIVKKSALHKKQLEELTRWMFEKRDGKTVLGESRNLEVLAKILESPKALKVLRLSKNLDLAYQETNAVEQDLERLVYAAKGNLQQANSVAPQVSPTPAITRGVDDVVKQAEALKVTVSRAKKR